jgi:ParB family chromosome partitioning protein
MLWNVPETGEQQGREPGTRRLAVAGAIERRQRTVLTMVPVAAVHPNPEQPRKHFGAEKLAELAASIKSRGLLQPIVVRRVQDSFELLAGERRFRAAQLAGLDRLPALVRDADDPLEIALIENLQREDLSPLEEAEGLAGLIERHGYSHQEVAELLGKSRPYVSNTLALLRLPDQVKGELHQGGRDVSRELLMAVARETEPDAALSLWRRLREETPSVRAFRAGTHGMVRERPALREVLLAVRRVNRALRRLLADGKVPATDAPHLRRVLRRTERLVQRQLSALAGPAA